MRIGEYFKRKRIEKGLDLKQLAKLISDDFEESRLWDFEDFDDEDIDGWSIVEFRRYCAAIGISPTEFADVPIFGYIRLPAPAACQDAQREEKGISIEALSERIGFYPTVIEAMENDRKDVVVCLGALKVIAKELDIPFKVLLGKI